MKPSYDELNAEVLTLTGGGDQVMMEWEKPYMKALVERLSPSGDVLEIGFGLGYSASYISEYPITSYTVIESDPEVAKRALDWASNQTFPVRVVEGPWQETLKYLGKFDAIFFDDFAHGKYQDPLDIRLYFFYYEVLTSHVNLGAKLVWFCDSPIYWVSYPSTTWSNEAIQVSVPENCKYNNSGKMYLPLVTFLEGSDPVALPIVLDKYLTFRKVML
jgi:guanidinoacetate N-methyltransferase